MQTKKYINFKNLFVRRPKAINIGNATKIYRGRAENVPDEAGIKTASRENNKYENRIFFFQAT